MAKDERFDAAYYRRYYQNRRTAVGSPADTQRLSDFVATYLRYLRLPVRSVLDLGCGLGWWRDALHRHFPRASYLGVEYSQYLCDRHGWTQGSAADFDPGRQFDLVVCQGVMQYLDDKAAAAALRNVARLCRGALYLEALTRRDWRQNCDRDTTDGKVNLRTGEWYRRRLLRAFHNCGGGMFVRRSAPVTLFELETLA